MRDAIIFFNQSGRGVKVDGLGTYLPKIDLNGRFSIEHRLDMDIKNALNTPDIFTGDVLNKENIGLTPDQLLAIWNEKHPTDQVTP